MSCFQTAEIASLLVSKSGALKEGKFRAIWALDGINRNSQTRHVSNSTTSASN